LATARRRIGGVDPGHLLLVTPDIGMVDQRQAAHGTPCSGGIGICGHPEYLVPGEICLREPDVQLLGRDLRQHQRQDRRPSVSIYLEDFSWILSCFSGRVTGFVATVRLPFLPLPVELSGRLR
jgi:hypothetical protein